MKSTLIGAVNLTLLLLLSVYEIQQSSAQLQAPEKTRGYLTDVYQLTDEERNAVVTLLFKEQIAFNADIDFQEKLRSSVASALNERFGHSSSEIGSENLYTKDDVIIIIQRINRTDPTSSAAPEASHQISMFIVRRINDNGGGRLVPAIAAAEAINRERNLISERVGRHLANVFSGTFRKRRLPRAESETTAPPKADGEGDIWEQHRWLFIAIIIFICISLLLTVICCICLKCCKKSRKKQPEEFKDETKIIYSPSGPMQEHSQPNEPPPIDEENGWIIPLDQMTKEELEQPEVQVSRL